MRGKWVVPGFIDLHTHLREPGHEYKEDIVTGTRAAAAGGFTAVCAMPNTNPPNDNRAVTELIVRRAREVGAVRVYPVGAISKGLAGETLAEMGELKEAGCVAVSDDGRPVMNAELMRRAMEYARTFGLTIVQHCEDLSLSAGGAMNEGIVSTRAGIRAQPASAESAMVARDIELCALTGARYHVAHISSADSVRLVREAKRRGLPVTCEVTPHHLTLTDEACAGYDTSTKCNPPLRTSADVDGAARGAGRRDHRRGRDRSRAALAGREGRRVRAGGVRHDRPRDGAAAGARAGPCRDADAGGAGDAHERRARRAAFGLPGGTLADGAAADVTVIDPEATWTVDAVALRSRSRNTPFSGRTLRGRAALTVVGGTIAYSGERLT